MEECGGCAFGKNVMVGWCDGYDTSMDEVGVLNMATCMYIHTYIGPFPLPILQRAVLTLREKGSNEGLFLVRPHSSKPNHYALTVMYQNTPYHFEIVCQVRGHVEFTLATGTLAPVCLHSFISPHHTVTHTLIHTHAYSIYI